MSKPGGIRNPLAGPWLLEPDDGTGVPCEALPVSIDKDSQKVLETGFRGGRTHVPDQPGRVTGVGLSIPDESDFVGCLEVASLLHGFLTEDQAVSPSVHRLSPDGHRVEGFDHGEHLLQLFPASCNPRQARAQHTEDRHLGFVSLLQCVDPFGD